MMDIHVEPSKGTHFFQNIITFNIGYSTIGTEYIVSGDSRDSARDSTHFVAL